MTKLSSHERKERKKRRRRRAKERAAHRRLMLKYVKITAAGAAALLIVAAAVAGLVWYSSLPGEHDDFAKCLAEKNATMYGADWCHNCQSQKRKFGKSFKHADYVQCPENAQLCVELGIEGYPTWIFDDGSRHQGVMELEELASKTGCEL